MLLRSICMNNALPARGRSVPVGRSYFSGASPVYPTRFTPEVITEIRTKLKKSPRITLKKDPSKPFRRAAVLIPLMNVEGKAAILYTKRPDTLRTHSGQVSFPGGGEDPEDNGNLTETAIRETNEEIGLARSKVDVIGLFDEAISIHGVFVTPVIAFCGDYNPRELTPSQEEVEKIFCVTLEDLTAPGARIEENLARGKIARFVKSPYPIWGMTGYLTDLLLKKLLAGIKTEEEAVVN